MQTSTAKADCRFQSPIVWRNVLLLGALHLLALGSFYSFLYIRWYTLFFAYVPILLANLVGITAGAHRLWAHRSYKAKLPLRIFLMLCHTIALQNDIYVWVRDHRVHHKYSETNGDPHNANRISTVKGRTRIRGFLPLTVLILFGSEAFLVKHLCSTNRGFFFAHMGWLLCRKHPDVKSKGASVDLSDLRADPVVMFQHRFYKPLVFVFWFLMPTLVPWLLWSENLVHSFLTCVCFRYIFALHCTWSVNSLAHLHGNQPYDRNLQPRENEFVIFASFGEGYHNFHHTFPWDYSTSEFGWMKTFNLTTLLIDFFAWIGQVEQRKVVPPEVVRKRAERTGDGLPNQRSTLLHQLTGLVFGTVAIWLPSSLRIFCNYCTKRDLLT